MGEDEAGTLAQLRTHLRELIDRKIGKDKGRIVTTTSDEWWSSFRASSRRPPVRSQVQPGMAARNVDVPKNQRIEFRVGIHQGDIISARLEGLTEPGGICMSGRVRSDAAGKIDVAFDDLGERQVKNIASPMHVFAIRLGPGVHAPRSCRLRDAANDRAQLSRRST
jgi:adenylate cyclase